MSLRLQCMKNIARDASGMTLIEIIIAIVLIGIAIPSIMIPFSGLDDSQRPEIAVQATYLAQRQMEAFAEIGYDNLAASTDSHSTCANFVANGTGLGNISCSVADFTDYTFTWAIEDVTAGTPSTQSGGATFGKKVTLTITHSSGDSYKFYEFFGM